MSIYCEITRETFRALIPVETPCNKAEEGEFYRRRVYCAISSNIGTLYIRYKGRDLILDTEYRLQDLRRAAA